MSPDGTHAPADAAHDTDPKVTFPRYFNGKLEQNGWKAADFRRRLEEVGARGRWTKSTVSNWGDGGRPSESACFYIARAFREPVPDVLAAAGYGDIAEIWAYETRPTEGLEELRRRNASVPRERWGEIERDYLDQVGHAYELAAFRGADERRRARKDSHENIDLINGTS